MDIIVEGRGEKSFRPDQVEISFNFETKDKSYEMVLEKGTANVKQYCDVLKKLGFRQDELKTRSFRVAENSKYDNKSRNYIKDGFIYTQTAVLKFDYNRERLAEFMEVTSKCKNPPKYYVNFGVKEEKAAQEEMLALAFEDAKFQANAIAKASGTEVKECLKTSFQPFDEEAHSLSRYEGEMLYKSSTSARENISAVFVPDDVKLSTRIYCLFVAK